MKPSSGFQVSIRDCSPPFLYSHIKQQYILPFILAGMSLTLADGGKKAFSFYGPPSMDRFWASTRRFMYRPDLSVSIHDATTMGPIGCKECTVHPIAFENKASTSISQRFYVSYVCETPPKAGKFDVAKASALGVPKGPLFAKLKSGEDVSLPDGSVVRSADVVEQADLGRFCAIVASIDFQGANAAALLEEFCGLPQWKRSVRHNHITTLRIPQFNNYYFKLFTYIDFKSAGLALVCWTA